MEVTGVSRSGRVRKKSSKLTDFQSPDEIAEAARIQKKAKSNGNYSLATAMDSLSDASVNLPPALTTSTLQSLTSPAAVNVKIEADLDIDDSAPQLLSLINDIKDDDQFDAPIANYNPTQEEDDDDYLMIDTTVRKSAYMTEKSPKKKLRKDKGKTRYTAYIMWSKEQRQEMLKSNPDMDFSALSRRLGEMWANVPGTEKYNWRRRAKRMATKVERPAKIAGKPKQTTVAKKGAALEGKASKSKFLNRNAATSKKKSDKNESHSKSGSSPSTSRAGATKSKAPSIAPGAYRVTGTGPTDVAAYLKLLGDNLSVIGQRLKEHEVNTYLISQLTTLVL